MVESEIAKARNAKKQIEFQDKILNKIVEVLDGITIDPLKGVILTARKKRKLAELRKLEEKFFAKKKVKD
jgi:Mg-chelatase subunit ChlI